jgi:hypothetical protein
MLTFYETIKHQKRKKSFGSQVPVVDPEPVVTIRFFHSASAIDHLSNRLKETIAGACVDQETCRLPAARRETCIAQ